MFKNPDHWSLPPNSIPATNFAHLGRSAVTAAPAVSHSTALHRYGSSFLPDSVNLVQQAERAQAHPRAELKNYLSGPLKQTDNVLHYWGHNTTYGVLRRMARDYLAIQGLATPRRARILERKSDRYQAAQLLNHRALRGPSGPENAGALAARRIEALIAELDADFGFVDEEDDYNNNNDIMKKGGEKVQFGRSNVGSRFGTYLNRTRRSSSAFTRKDPELEPNRTLPALERVVDFLRPDASPSEPASKPGKQSDVAWTASDTDWDPLAW
ncbi:hypothetical protein C8F04DRAFT_1335357 [Mycena alexandri]|uniref:Uncharacterized protein n=1 Tax=Mycena alexandri TaxID=1745969 RepID=A0AAD6T020_9AGAR|nr:hypothetical protein C8F04DRAFT_1335357 [Mycena alexandri]